MNFTIRRFWLGVMMAVSLLGCAWGAEDVVAGVRVKAEAGDAVSQELLGHIYGIGQFVLR